MLGLKGVAAVMAIMGGKYVLMIGLNLQRLILYLKMPP